MHVVFCAPFFMDTTLRFVRAVAAQPGVACSLLTQEPPQRVPEDIRSKLAGFCQIDDALDTRHIVRGVQALALKHGPVEKLFGALEHIQVQLAEAREQLKIPGLSSESAKNFRDKARMKDLLHNAKVPCARHQEVQSSSDAWAFAGKVGYPVVLKPLAGAGSTATFRADNDKQLAEALLNVRPSQHHPAIIEEFVVGDEYSFETVCIEGKPVWWSLTRYLPNPLDAVRNSWIQWCVLLPREIKKGFDDVRDANFATLKALGQTTGLTHMEWFRKPDGGVAVSEIAARPPGAQIVVLNNLAHDFDLFHAWARLMCFGEFQAPERKYAAGAAFLRGQNLTGGQVRGRIRAVYGLEQVQRELGPIIAQIQVPRIGALPSSSYEGDGFVLVRHPETRVVEKALKRIVELVRVEVG